MAHINAGNVSVFHVPYRGWNFSAELFADGQMFGELTCTYPYSFKADAEEAARQFSIKLAAARKSPNLLLPYWEW